MTLFNETNDSKKTGPVIDPNKDYLAELVGEGKKFADPKELARGKVESDVFIETLKSELAEMRKELNTRLTAEEIMNKLTEKQNQLSSGGNKPSDPPSNSGNQSNEETRANLTEQQRASGLSAEDVEKVILQHEQKRRQQDNVAFATNELKKAYGDDFVRVLKDRARELDVTEAFLDNMAATSPKSLLALIGTPNDKDQSQKTTNKNDTSLFVPPTGLRNSASTNSNSMERNKAYYDKLKKDDPKTYWSVNTQSQMHKDAVRLGASFFS